MKSSAGHQLWVKGGSDRGDVAMVTRIDSPARCTFDLFVIVKRVMDAEAQFRSLSEPCADTGTSAQI